MGNFSRDTFQLNQNKSYVAVRLEQGVPLVDADWNELQDMTRYETYDALRAAAPNVARRGELVLTSAGANDMQLSPGTVVIDGRPVRLNNPLQYSMQRYANAATAAADGVSVVTPLTQPAGLRNDVVYLDVFEREVTSAEDAVLINGAIGIETSTRLKRELVLRVSEGTTTPPAVPAGHRYLVIAFLNRTAAGLGTAQIQDMKPYALPLGAREASFSPAFSFATWSGTTYAPWTLDTGSPSRLWARKLAPAFTFGVLQIHVPDGARLLQLSLRGSATGNLYIQFARARQDAGASIYLTTEVVSGGGPFTRQLTIPATEPPADNSVYRYELICWGYGVGNIDIYGGSLRYAP